MFIKVWYSSLYWVGEPYTRKGKPIETFEELAEYVDNNEFFVLKIVFSSRKLLFRVHGFDIWEEVGLDEAIDFYPEVKEPRRKRPRKSKGENEVTNSAEG